MAPLDTGLVKQTLRLVDTEGRKIGPSPDDYETLGAYLKAVRTHGGLTLADVAKVTRIRRLYIAAMEDGDRSALPSRPFAIGYVRSYARALGLDGELAVARFKADWPESAEPLRNPIGVEHDETDNDARRPLIWAGVTVVVVALGLWNIAQRALVNDAPATSGLDPLTASQPLAPPPGPVKLDAAAPPPQESTLPPPYVTPGLAQASGADPAGPDANAPQIAAYGDPTVFTPRGAVFGDKAGAVILQAKMPTSLVVRGADKTVYFARQLAQGEAYRAPQGRGLIGEMTNPSAIALYVGGALKAPLTGPVVQIDALTPSAATPPPP